MMEDTKPNLVSIFTSTFWKKKMVLMEVNVIKRSPWMVPDVAKRLNFVVLRTLWDLEGFGVQSQCSNQSGLVKTHPYRLMTRSNTQTAFSLKPCNWNAAEEIWLLKEANYSGAQCKHTDVLCKQRKEKRLGEEIDVREVEKRWKGQTDHVSLQLSQGLNKLLHTHSFIFISYIMFISYRDIHYNPKA